MDEQQPRWTFLTNHAHVLLCLSRYPAPRLRDIAEKVGITERAAVHILMELEELGYLKRHRVGRRNTYELHLDQPLRHPLERMYTVGELLAVLGADPAVNVEQSKPRTNETAR
jgi:hypothetical protein